MSEFDEWYEKETLNGWVDKEWMMIAFEAGQQSQQAKIDELNADFRKVGMALATATKETIIWMDKSKKSDFINQGLELKIDELQNKLDEQNKVIDEVFKIIHNSYMSYENENLETVYDKVKELLK